MSRGDVRPESSSTTPGSGWRVGLLLFLSGAAALAHQILWTRRLVDWLGASAETFARVVGAFFLGLALGSAWAAWRPAGADSAWLRVRRAEFLVALTALLPLVVVGGLGSESMPGWVVGGPGRWILPILLIGPPAFAMGLVFPAVTEAAVARASAGEARSLLRWYGCNTLGGVLGLGWVFFVGLPRLGLVGTSLATCGINVVVAMLAGVLKPESGSAGHVVPRSLPETTRGGGRGEAGSVDPVGAGGWAVAAISGFGVLALEVVLQHQVAQVAINSYYSSAVVLAGVLIGLGAAAFVGIGGWRASRVLSMAAMVCALEPILFQVLHPGLAMLPYDLPPWRYFARLAGLVLLVGLPVFGGLGWVFPWLLRQARNGSTVAGWLAVNGVGGWLGTEVSQGWLLPGIGIWGAAAGVAVLYGLAALGLARNSNTAGEARPWLMRLRVLMPEVLAISLGLASLVWNRNRAQVRPVPGDRVVEVGAGREGVVAVVSGATNDWRIVFNNTYTLGGSRAAVNQERQALLPALMHAKPRRVALLGFATGSTTAGAAQMPGVESIEAFELSPLAAALAGRHFRPWNRGVLDDPRVRLVVEDARIGILGRSAYYDLVVGDLFMPWRTGEGRLYSREHFASVRRSLAPGGLFCQWFPLFQLTGRQWEVIRRTFREQFPGVFAIRGDFYADLPIVGLCGFADGRGMESLDWAAISAACTRLREAGDRAGAGMGVEDPLVRHPEGIAMALLGPDPGVGPGTVNTLGNAWIEWDAGRNVCGLREPWMVGVPWAQWARDLHRGGVERMPREWRMAHDAGQFFLTLEVAVLSKSPVRGNLEAQIPERLPFALRTDRSANWEAWPSRVKIGPPAGSISSGNGG